MKSVLAALVVLGVACGVGAAAENPQVAAIHEKIKELRAQEKVVLKEVHAWYEGFIKRDKVTEEVMREDRRVLKAQEDSLLAVATTEEARAAIRKQFESMRALLRVDIKIDAEVIRELRALEKSHEKYIADNYKAAVLALDEQARLAAAAAKTPPKRR